MLAQRTLGDWLLHLAAHGSSLVGPRRRRVYILTSLLALSLVWGPTLLFLQFKPPSYTSQWVLLLPDASAGHAVNLDSVGQASRSAMSPYANQVIDPRVNYKSIAMSAPVIEAAAASLDISPAAFGEPRVKLADQTSLMEFEIAASSAAAAQAKAQALQQAFEQELASLREDELARREGAATQSLQALSDKLMLTQKDIVRFQLQAGIVSLDQFRELAMSVETLRQELLRLEIARDGLVAQTQTLLGTLGVAAGDAGALLALQADPGFQQLLSQVAAADSGLTQVQARLGPNHFEVRRASATLAGLEQGLARRAQQLGLQTTTATMEHWARSDAAHGLVKELVSVQAELAQVEGEIAAHQSHIQALSARVDAGAEDAISLEDLQRKQQVAMAVFTTALAKLDLGRTDVYASYPLLQTLLPPTRPSNPDAMATTLAILAALAGSFMCLSALVLLWIRKPYIQKIFLSESSGTR